MNLIELLFAVALIMVLMVIIGRFAKRCYTANNEGVAGTHQQANNKLADATWNNRHCLVQIGSDSNHVNLCNQATRPYGFTKDAPGAQGDLIQVGFLSCNVGTILLNAIAAVAQNADVFTSATPGYVTTAPLAAGSYWKVGYAKEASQETQDAEYLVEVEPQSTVLVIVDANGNKTLAI